jgi:hypothetical protein
MLLIFSIEHTFLSTAFEMFCFILLPSVSPFMSDSYGAHIKNTFRNYEVRTFSKGIQVSIFRHTALSKVTSYFGNANYEQL